LEEVLRQISKKDYEIIVVDHHSKDKTAEVAKKYGAKVIFDEVGKGWAIRRGLETAKGDIVITMDADLSHRHIEIGLLTEAIKAGYDIAMGSRFIQGGGTEDMPLLRRLGNKFFVLLVNLLWNTNYTDLCYGYRSFRKSCVKKLDLESDGFGIEAEIAIKAAKKKLNTIEIPSFEKKRVRGRGKLRTFRDGWIILKTIIREM
jgi:glycosyltransferase involved in cell wall biosynthesis